MRVAFFGSLIILALFFIGSMKKVERPIASAPLSTPSQAFLDELSPRVEYILVPGACVGEPIFTYNLNE